MIRGIQPRVYEFLAKEKQKTKLLITKNEKEAKSVYDTASFLAYEAYMLPDFRANYADDLRSFKEELFELFATLHRYFQSKKQHKILISPVRTLIHPLPKEALFQTFPIAFADTVSVEKLKHRLLYWGYSFVDIVEERGEVSFRGDIIDIYPIDAAGPYRISLFDDEVESIRYFECETQKSVKDEIESITVIPAYFGFSEDAYETVLRAVESIKSDSFIKDIPSLGLWCLNDLATDYIELLDAVTTHDLSEEIEEIFSFHQEAEKKSRFLALPVIEEEKQYKEIEIAELNTFLEYHRQKKIKIIARNEAIIKQAHINPEIKYQFVESDVVVNLLSDDELILSLNNPVVKKRRKKSTIVLDDLKQGDYVVHENYGIGIFKGLTNTTVLGAVKDFVEIAYQGDDRLLIPVENLNVIDRYISEGGHLAILDKLGKGSFQKLKAKAKTKLLEIAKEIIEIAAKRELAAGSKISVDSVMLRLFQNDAGFVYTEDQNRSIEAILNEMHSGKIMDMLLSGDVGFGKTEVAMNTLFAAVKSGYQAAFIAPTTLLTSQHYKTLKERLEKYEIKVAKIDRFTKPKEKTEIKEALKNGHIHVCIGTHSLLGMEFNNLALLIIDEEHKFGVKQKEKLKNLRENLHILSMSATPIPRSLNMALSSIKQYAQLLTPPGEREDVRTFVKEYDEKLIKEILLREIRRGGQIFYIHNRIASIEDKKEALLELLPELKILVLHSQITASVTEKEMLAFENKKYDILLSTSIVESGIHIPNVNTIVVESADNFGIADLHQLRGRVGRSKRQGYCYYLVDNKEKLTDQSRKRLIALESNSFLGSGSVLAYHDLEIRGGGNLIGEAQSGHIKNIGYSLYLKMLEDSINLLLNQAPVKKKEVDIKLTISAYLNSDCIGEDRIRLELYRRLSKCESVNEVYEIEEEMIDRFGKLDTPTKQFLEVIIIKILASDKAVKTVSNYQQNITFTYENEEKASIKAGSKDDDDLIKSVLEFLRKK